MYLFLLRMAYGPYYWLGWVCLSLAMFGLALYYQYALDYEPCVLCIQVRIGVLAIALVALFGWFMQRHRKLCLLAHVLTTLLLAGLTQRAWMLLGTERGWIEGSCSMESGLPAWFALDSWFPSLFGIAVPCGYTPLLWLDVSMAEALLVIFSLGTLLSLILVLISLRTPPRAR